MDKPLKIAIYSGAVPSTNFIERLIHGLAASGNEVYLFGVKKSNTKPVSQVYYYTYRNTKLSKFFQLVKYSLLLTIFKTKEKKWLDKIISSKKKNTRLLKVKYYPVLYHCPDIFHLQWAKSLDDWIWVQDFGMKLVLSLRGTHITISPLANTELTNMYVQFFPKVDGFHAVSKATSSVAQNYGALPSKIKTIYSGLPVDELVFHPKTEREGLFKILSVGRSHWTKGYVHALDAMALLKKEGINFHYAIVGVDDDEELQFQRSQLSLEKEVLFLKPLSFEDVILELKKADLLLLSSVEEGIANVVLEAMALGTLVVSTHCGGMDEVITPGENGFLVPIRNPKEMTMALQKVIALSLEDYQNITKAARKTVERQHTIEKMVTDMESLYESILKNKL